MDQVKLVPLQQIHNPKGDVLHGIKSSDATFSGFGEAYFSSIKYQEVKGWKKHHKMVLNLIVPVGAIQFVIYDDRDNSPSNGEFKSIVLSLDNYQRLTIPPGLWVAFRGIGVSNNLLLNVASIEHDASEAENLPLDIFDYHWSQV